MDARTAAERLSSFAGRLTAESSFDRDDFDAIEFAIEYLLREQSSPPQSAAPNRREGLFVGTNYVGTNNALGGCVADARAWREFFMSKGFKASMLLEHNAHRAAIIDGLTRLVAIPNAKLVFQYSGHGTYVPDRNGDEPDRRDEALCPNDFRRAGLILDDEIASILGGLAEGSELLVIMDCCHSGSNTREGTAGRFVAFEPSFVTASQTVSLRALDTSRITTLAACQDSQAAADTGHSGAFTDAMLQSFEPHGPASSWLNRAAELLRRGGYNQTPKFGGVDLEMEWVVQ